jgi:hypothetical protein
MREKKLWKRLSNMTIEISEKLYDSCKNMAETMAKQDGRLTQHPLFYVYQKVEVGVDRRMDFDYIERLFDGDVRGWSGDLCENCLEIYKEDGMEALPEVNTDCGCELIYLKTEDEPCMDVGPFFTEEEAQRHIDANHYHYKKPFIYVNSAWRNPEMQTLLKTIFGVAGIEVPRNYV